MEMGSKPEGSVAQLYPRPELKNAMKELYVNNKGDSTCFGVIVGPSGTGKTIAVKDLCHTYPEGVFYHEISDPKSFVLALAEEVGMKIKPLSVFDLMLEYISAKYCHYHQIPDYPLEGIAVVLNTLREAAVEYKSRQGRVPILISLLNTMRVFNRLLIHTKILANDNKLSIVFISSEGSVLPLLEDNSSSNRALKALEILDISDKEAVRYLTQKIEENDAWRIVDLVGGRFVYLRLQLQLGLDLNRQYYPKSTVAQLANITSRYGVQSLLVVMVFC